MPVVQGHPDPTQQERHGAVRQLQRPGLALVRTICSTCYGLGVTSEGATCPACKGSGQDTDHD